MSDSLELEAFKQAIIKVVETTWRYKAAVIACLVFFIALKITDLFWAYQERTRIDEIARQVTIDAQRTNANARWERFLSGEQHRQLINQTCTKHHMEPAWPGYPFLPRPDNGPQKNSR